MLQSIRLISVLYFTLYGLTEAIDDTWAILINTSAWYINYRHSANVYYFQKLLQEWGVPEDHIIHLQAHECDCDPRNPQPHSIYINESNTFEEFDQNNLIQNIRRNSVDYKSIDIQEETITRILSGTKSPFGSPREKVLKSSDESRIMVYLTGHGGDEFIKLRDWHDLEANQISIMIDDLYAKGMYREMLWLADSCEVSTLDDVFTSPNIYAIGSSIKDQSAWSYSNSPRLLNSITDIWTYNASEYLSKVEDVCVERNASDEHSIQQFHDLLKTKSRQMGLQDAELTVSPNSVKNPENMNVLKFLSECFPKPRVTGYSEIIKVNPVSDWEIPPVIPNRLGPKTIQQADPVPGRFVATARLARNEGIYDKFSVSAIAHREQLVKYTDELTSSRFPVSFPVVSSAFIPQDRSLSTLDTELFASRWEDTRSFVMILVRTLTLVLVTIALGLRLLQ